jgi:Zn-finger nucleic acid-binding protein
MLDRCPRDGTLLQHAAIQRQCRSCHGLWLPAALVGGIVGHRPQPTAAMRSHNTGLCCPDDGKPLYPLQHAGVEIDLCGTCGGVWLDHGELERVLARDEQDDDTSLLDALGDAVESRDAAPRTPATAVPERASVTGLAADTRGPTQLPDEAGVAPSADATDLLSIDAAESSLLEVPGQMALATIEGIGNAAGVVFEFIGDALSGL